MRIGIRLLVVHGTGPGTTARLERTGSITWNMSVFGMLARTYGSSSSSTTTTTTTSASSTDEINDFWADILVVSENGWKYRPSAIKRVIEQIIMVG
jgi:hypothetical protein